MSVKRWVALIAVAGLILATLSDASLSTVASAAPSLKSRLLEISNMPVGWSVTHRPASTQTTPPACLQAVRAGKNGPRRTSVTFVKGTAPFLVEVLASGKGQIKRWRLLHQSLGKCRSFTLTLTGKNASGSIGRMSFPAIGSKSSAYSMTLAVTHINLGYDIVLFKAGKYVGLVAYGDIGTPDITTVVAFTKEAVAKAVGKSVTAPTTAD